MLPIPMLLIPCCPYLSRSTSDLMRTHGLRWAWVSLLSSFEPVGMCSNYTSLQTYKATTPAPGFLLIWGMYKLKISLYYTLLLNVPTQWGSPPPNEVACLAGFPGSRCSLPLSDALECGQALKILQYSAEMAVLYCTWWRQSAATSWSVTEMTSGYWLYGEKPASASPSPMPMQCRGDPTAWRNLTAWIGAFRVVVGLG